MHRTSILLCSVYLAGCVNLNDVYLHDPALASAAAEAEATFNEASTRELWDTMARNVAASDEAERAMLAQSAKQRFEGQLQKVETLTWQDLWDCGQGLCWTVAEAARFGVDLSTIDAGLLHDQPTQQKIAYLAGQISQKSAEIEILRDSISQHLPVSETSPLTFSSSLSNAIAEMERNVAAMESELDALKREKLQRLEEELNTLLEPITNPFPERRAAILQRVNEEIEVIRGDLGEVASVRALPSELTESLLAAIADLLPEGLPTELRANLAARLNEFVAVDEIDDVLDERVAGLDSIIASAEDELVRVETLTIEALGADRNLSTRSHAINDLLRKSGHLDLVKLETVESMLGDQGLARLQAAGDRISIADKLDELKDQAVSDEFAAEFAESTGRDLCGSVACTVGDVLDYLKTDESKLEAIRTALRDDFRRATVTGYSYELQTLQRELGLIKEIVGVVREQRSAQAGFSSILERHIDEYRIGDLDVTVYHQLDCLARSAGRTHGEGCEANTQRAREQFTSTLLILTRYFSLEGDLREQEIALWRNMARTKHLRSIEASRTAALAHEQFIASGFQGLTAFTEGGITTEQLASVLRFINTGLLAVIAGEQ